MSLSSQRQWVFATLGTQLLAALVNNVFYGISACMIFQYFRIHARRDRLRTKLMVCLLTIASSLQVVFVNIQLMDNLVMDFTTYDFLTAPITITILGKYIAVFVTSFIAQLFYATRIWSIAQYVSKNFRFLALPVVLFSSTQLGAGLAQVELMRTSANFAVFAEKILSIRKIVAIQGSATTCCDVTITVLISYILRTSRTGIRRTDSLLDKIVRFSVHWAAATSFCSVFTICLFYYSHGTLFFNLTWLLNTHLHVMSVISVLISREGLRGHLDRSFHMSDLSMTAVVPEVDTEDMEERLEIRAEDESSGIVIPTFLKSVNGTSFFV